MTYRKREMEATLPEASRYLCQHLWTKLNEAGVNHIAAHDIELIARLVSDYIKNTAEGKRTALKLLGAELSAADYRNAYYPDSKANDPRNRIPHTDLVEYRGWLYKGAYSLPYYSIDIDTSGNMEACETTGILGPKDYCVRVVKVRGSDGREYLQSMSNYARAMSEDMNVRESASLDKCKSCFVKECEFNPAREMRQQPLKAIGGIR